MARLGQMSPLSSTTRTANLQTVLVCWRKGVRGSAPRSGLSSSSASPSRLFSARPHRQQSKTRTALLASCLALGGAAYYLVAPERKSATLNGDTFVPYTVVSREAISPSSVVLTVAPRTPDPSPAYLRPGTPRWRHALWSVEFKQPEVQIARHYTPLPPADDDAARQCLRFYVRAVEGGEMSSYLSRLGVGRDVWLRGPHAGFDVVRQLGSRRRVVFLAGGTGLVPAMQVAAAVLDESQETTMTVLWAVRKREEVRLIDEPRPSWWLRWSSKAPTQIPADLAEPSAVARHLMSMKAKYGARLEVRVAVDEAGTAIRETDVEEALLRPSPGAGPAPPSQGCPSHDQRLHADASEFAGAEVACRCPPSQGSRGPGKNLLIVSGPEGFVARWAGPKAWLRGTLRQGPVGGVAARMQGRHASLADDWLVLKL